MRSLPLFLIFLFLLSHSNAQEISSTNHRALREKEDSLKPFALKIVQGINPADRFKADSLFTKGFVRALKIPQSFYYSFDSLHTISQLYAPDSSFKVFTWQMMINDNIIRQHGAIQMRTADGSLKLFPLIDKSDVTVNYADTIGNNYGWMGAIYYKIILTKNVSHSYYTLLGYDENNIRSNKKIIEVLEFVNGQPLFGGPYFTSNTNARYVMEFKKEASPRLAYDADLDMIIFEHLVSESGEPNKKFTLIPDGDYEGFKWQNGKWTYVNKVFNQITPENKEPVPVPIRDAKGTIDERKLKDNEGSKKKDQ